MNRVQERRRKRLKGAPLKKTQAEIIAAKKMDDSKKADLLKKFKTIEETGTIEEIKEFYKDYPKQDIVENLGFISRGGPDDLWKWKKSEISAPIWRAVYKLTKYNPDGNSEYHGKDGIIYLDFGCGNSMHELFGETYLVELNDWAYNEMLKFYKDCPNVHLFQNLSDILKLDIKFDVVYSRFAIEHVRYINEYLETLCYLCKETGTLDINFPYDNSGAPHCAGLYIDTQLDDKYRNISGINIG